MALFSVREDKRTMALEAEIGMISQSSSVPKILTETLMRQLGDKRAVNARLAKILEVTDVSDRDDTHKQYMYFTLLGKNLERNPQLVRVVTSDRFLDFIKELDLISYPAQQPGAKRRWAENKSGSGGLEERAARYLEIIQSQPDKLELFTSEKFMNFARALGSASLAYFSLMSTFITGAAAGHMSGSERENRTQRIKEMTTLLTSDKIIDKLNTKEVIAFIRELDRPFSGSAWLGLPFVYFELVTQYSKSIDKLTSSEFMNFARWLATEKITEESEGMRRLSSYLAALRNAGSLDRLTSNSMMDFVKKLPQSDVLAYFELIKSPELAAKLTSKEALQLMLDIDKISNMGSNLNHNGSGHIYLSRFLRDLGEPNSSTRERPNEVEKVIRDYTERTRLIMERAAREKE